MKTKRAKKPIFALIIAASALVLAVLPAVAQSPTSDLMGVNSSGITATQAAEFQNGSSFLYTSNSFPFTATSAAQFGHPTEIFSGGTVSDIFGVAKLGPESHPTFQLAFMSDVEGGLDLTAAQQFFGSQTGWINGGVETDFAIYDITQYIDQTKCPGCGGAFESPPDAVPDSGMTVTLLGTALAGIGALRWKLRAA